MSNTDIFNRLHSASSYHPASVEMFDDFTLEAGDVITVAKGSNSYTLPIFRKELNWSGTSVITLESSGNRERAGLPELERRDYANASQNYQYQKNLVTQVDTLVANRISALNISALTARVGALEADYVSTQTFNAEKAYVRNMFSGLDVIQYADVTKATIVNFQVATVDDSTTTYHRFAPATITMGTILSSPNQLRPYSPLILVESDASGNTTNLNLQHYHELTLTNGVLTLGQVRDTAPTGITVSGGSGGNSQSSPANPFYTTNFNVGVTDTGNTSWNHFVPTYISMGAKYTALTQPMVLAKENTTIDLEHYHTITAAESQTVPGQINITLGAVASTAQTANFNIADTAFYQNAISAVQTSMSISASLRSVSNDNSSDEWRGYLTLIASGSDGHGNTVTKTDESQYVVLDDFYTTAYNNGITYDRSLWTLQSSNAFSDIADLALLINSDLAINLVNNQWMVTSTASKYFTATDGIQTLYGTASVGANVDTRIREIIGSNSGTLTPTSLSFGNGDIQISKINGLWYATSVSNKTYKTVDGSNQTIASGTASVYANVDSAVSSAIQDYLDDATVSGDGTLEFRFGVPIYSGYTITPNASDPSYASATIYVDLPVEAGRMVSTAWGTEFWSEGEASYTYNVNASSVYHSGFMAGYDYAPHSTWSLSPTSITFNNVSITKSGSTWLATASSKSYVATDGAAQLTGVASVYADVTNTINSIISGSSNDYQDGYDAGVAYERNQWKIFNPVRAFYTGNSFPIQKDTYNGVTRYYVDPPAYYLHAGDGTTYDNSTGQLSKYWSPDYLNITDAVQELLNEASSSSNYGTLTNEITGIAAGTPEYITTGQYGTARIPITVTASAHNNVQQANASNANMSESSRYITVSNVYRTGWSDGYSAAGSGGSGSGSGTVTSVDATLAARLNREDLSGSSSSYSDPSGKYWTNSAYIEVYGGSSGGKIFSDTVPVRIPTSNMNGNHIVRSVDVTKIERIQDSGGYQWYVTINFNGSTRRTQVNNVDLNG